MPFEPFERYAQQQFFVKISFTVRLIRLICLIRLISCITLGKCWCLHFYLIPLGCRRIAEDLSQDRSLLRNSPEIADRWLATCVLLLFHCWVDPHGSKLALECLSAPRFRAMDRDDFSAQRTR